MFIHAPRIAQLLRFLVKQALEDRPERLKETVLGVEVFGREPGYDPQADPIVRVTIRRLLQKLDQYHRLDGDNRVVRIELRPGNYTPSFHLRDTGLNYTASHAEGETGDNDKVAPPMPTSKNVFEAFRWAERGGLQIALSPSHFGHGDHPAFSPDGRSIAFEWRAPEEDTESIYIRCLDAEGLHPSLSPRQEMSAQRGLRTAVASLISERKKPTGSKSE